MEWYFWFTWFFLLNFWYSKLLWIYIKKQEALTENPPVQIYQSKIKNIIFFKIKTGYKLELLTPEATRLLGSTKKDVDTNKNSENVLKLESVEVVLLHCYLVKNDYKHSSKVLFSSK